MAVSNHGSLNIPPSFNAEQDATALRAAMKGIGTDEKTIINILCRRTNAQRQQIAKEFKTLYGRDLIDDLKSELSRNFEEVVIGLMYPPEVYDAMCLKKAIKGAGTDEACLIEILCSRTPQEVQAISAAYKTLHKKQLEEDIRGDASGHFGKLLISLSTGGRKEDAPVNPAQATADAKAIYEAGEKRLGTDESKFIQVLCVQSTAQLHLVFDEYKKIAQKTLEQSIKSEMSGDLEKGMLAIVQVARNRQQYFAERLYKSMKGAGTDDRTLIRLVVSRCEADMPIIKDLFLKSYGKTLKSFIEGDCSGDYKKSLLTLIGESA